MNRHARIVAWSVAVYRRVLFVYPRSFRRRNEQRMVETFAELCAAVAEDTGLVGMVALWLRTVADLVGNGVAARRAGKTDLQDFHRGRPLDSPGPRGVRPIDSCAPRQGFLMDDLVVDIRYALGTLRRSRGFAALAIATMGLGIGVNAAMFSFVDAVVLQPLPFPEPQRLVEVWETYQGDELELRNVGYPTLTDWRERVGAFDDIAAFASIDVALTDAGEAQRLLAQAVDSQLFDLLGAAPARGRVLVAADNTEYEQAPVAVLSYGLWQSTFGGEEGIVGGAIQLNGIATTVVGVMPPGFSDPYGAARLWLPMLSGLRVAQVPEAAVTSRRNRGLRTLARLAPQATPESTQAELDAVTSQLREEHPDSYVDRGALTLSLEEQVLGSTRDPVLLLMGAVGLVLLIACANVANLTMARAAGRDEEIAMRFALGAERTRLVRQLLTESTVLALLGGSVGLLLAYAGVDVLAAQLPFEVPQYITVGVDASVIVFTLAVTLATGLVFGLLPALTVSGKHLARALTARGTTRPGRRFAGLDARGLLVTAEIALSLALLVGAGLLLQSFAGMRTIDPGFEAEGLLTLSLELPASRYDTDQVAVFRDQLLQRLRGLPGVESAALAGDIPLLSGYSAIAVANEEGAASDPRQTIRVYQHSISPGYVGATGAELLAGREFERTDTAESPAVALVSEAMARRSWPGEEAVGRRLTRNGSDWVTVVGVLRDIRHRQLVVDTFVNPDDPDMYFPLAQVGARAMSVLVRGEGDADGLLEPLRRLIRQMDAELPVFDVTTMAGVVGEQLAINRASARMLTAFGALALVLAAIGIYGVMAAIVAARGREIGIRIALGAGRAHIVRVVLAPSITMAAFGIAAGVAAALASARLLESLLYGVNATDSRTIVVVAGVLLTATILASYVPVRRALAVDPATALQGE